MAIPAASSSSQQETATSTPQQQQQQSPPQPLTFPPSHFAKLAPFDFLHASLNSPAGIRPNGRKPTQCREPSINTGSLTNANGSAVVRLGSTSVVCGVRAELLPTSHIHGGLSSDLEAWQQQQPQDQGEVGEVGDGPPRRSQDEGLMRSDGDVIADLRLLVPNLELSTGCNAAHLPGNAPSAEAQGLTQRILALLKTSDLVGLAPLVVWHRNELDENDADGASAGVAPNPNNPDEMIDEGQGQGQGTQKSTTTGSWRIKAFWTLYIDILYISLDGGAFDAAWLAVLAALQDTLLPKAYWDDDSERILCSPLRQDARNLELRSLPVPLTAVVFSHAIQGKQTAPVTLYDPDDFEEAICQGKLLVVVSRPEDTTEGTEDQRGKRGIKGPKGSEGKQGHKVLRIEAVGKNVGSQQISAVIKEAAGERWRVWRGVLGWKS